MQARQAIIRSIGGPEVIEWQTVDVPAPGAGEVTLRQTAVGLNYIDTYHRRGIYPIDLPAGWGWKRQALSRRSARGSRD